jgi:hypothetical protein
MSQFIESVRRRARALGAAVVTLVFLDLTLASWRSWGDPVVDFPAQLYMAWRISAGDILYRDMQHFYGPLSQLFNGALFSIFGSGYIVLMGANLAAALAIALILYFFLGGVWGRSVGFVAGISFVLIHAFQNLGTVASNYIAPYSHEATHGTLILILLIAVSSRLGRGSRPAKWLAEGALAGLAFLTKPEFAVSAVLIVGLNLVLDYCRPPAQFKEALRPLLITIAGATIGPIAMFAYFAVDGRMGPADAFRSAFGAFSPLFTSKLTSNPLYDAISGSYQLGRNLLIACGASLAIAAALLPAPWIDRVENPMRFKILAGTYLAALAILLFVAPVGIVPRAWPLLSMAGLLLAAWLVFRRKLEGSRAKCALSFGIAAQVLAAKVYFNGSFDWLGFYLMTPATIFLCILGVGLVPEWLSRRMRPSLLPWASALFLLSIGIRNARASLAVYDRKTVSFGSGADFFLALGKSHFMVPSELMKEVIARVDRKTEPGSTLMTLPEGTLANYLLRRPNPTPFVSTFLVKTLFDAWGPGGAVLARLQSTPPDYVLYLHRPAEVPDPIYLIRGDGGFANQVLDWIEANYQEIDRIGPASNDFARLGYVLLRRTSSGH